MNDKMDLLSIKEKRAVVYIHRLYYDGKIKKGGMDHVIDYLIDNGFELTLFEFPLDYTTDLKATISKKTKESNTILLSFNMPKIFAQANWILEFFVNIVLSVKYVKKTYLVLTADPLATLPALVLRKLGLYKFIYYHSVDFSTDRFKNTLLNAIYFILLKAGIKDADVVGVVTQSAYERLKKYRNKNIYFIPNSPEIRLMEKYIKPVDKKMPFSMVVTCSSVAHKYLIHELVYLTEKLKKEFPDVILVVIGYFNTQDPYCVDMQQYVVEHSLEDNVVFAGNVSRETNYELISKCMLGLAYYDGNFSHVIYGDSIKIREYCALGLPVVADDKTYTAVEMAQSGAGYIANDFSTALAKISSIFRSPVEYDQKSHKSLELAKQYDKRIIMDGLFKLIYKTK